MKKKIIFISILLLLSLGLVAPAVNAQVAGDPTLNGLNDAAKEVDAFKNATDQNYTTFLQTKAGQLVGVILSFVGVLFLLLVVFAGISWMTADGNQEKVTKARGLMINAIIGIIIVFAAYAITSFIGDQILK